MRAYRVLVTGSRAWDWQNKICQVLRDELEHARRLGYSEFVVVHGKCPRGADFIAGGWARWMGPVSGVSIIEEPHPADWDSHGKPAGFIRNAEMVNLGAHACLAFYREGAPNRGTAHCAGLAEAAGIPVKRFTQ